MKRILKIFGSVILGAIAVLVISLALYYSMFVLELIAEFIMHVIEISAEYILSNILPAICIIIAVAIGTVIFEVICRAIKKRKK